jgi:hypothetical protein
MRLEEVLSRFELKIDLGNKRAEKLPRSQQHTNTLRGCWGGGKGV